MYKEQMDMIVFLSGMFNGLSKQIATGQATDEDLLLQINTMHFMLAKLAKAVSTQAVRMEIQEQVALTA